MKRWSGQIFPVVLLGLLAALSFWLQRVVDLPEGKHDGNLRHDPDAFVENFVARRLNVDGVLQSRLAAPRMRHYPDDDTLLFDRPKLTYYRPATPDLTLTSDQAFSTAKGEVVLMWGDVVATRAASAQRPQSVARMPDLTVRPDDGIAFTGSPVHVTEGKSWVKGVGMHLNNDESTLILESKVTGVYYKPEAHQ